MINFNEEQMMKNGDIIYSQRESIEKIADALSEEGFDLLFFTSSGGSMAMMQPFEMWISQKSAIPSGSMISADLTAMGCNRITDKTVAFLTSKSGDTPDTIEAAQYLKQRGVRLVSVTGVPDSPLEKLSDFCITYGEGRPQELVFYLLIGRLLCNRGAFPDYAQFADELKHLAAALVEVRKQADPFCLEYSKKYCREPYHIWIGSGDLWPMAYSYSMCTLEESLWLKTKSVSSPEFFHGTLELLEEDVCVTLLMTQGPTRFLDEKVKAFAQQYTKKFTCFDAESYALPGISSSFHSLLSPVIMAAVLQRVSKNMEAVTGHSLDVRRYYRKGGY